MGKCNPEGMTWEEWLAAACFGSKYANLSHVERSLTLPSDTYNKLKEAWKEGADPTEYAAKW